MDCQVKCGKVVKVTDFTKRQELLVEINGRLEKAINFPQLTGKCQVKDEVVVNTTAVALDLGTGGTHFVMAVVGKNRELEATDGHIMKLRYTPNQGRVLSVEEEASPDHQLMKEVDSLNRIPVVVGNLHSMLAPVCLGFKELASEKKIVYLMSDGAALPLGLSKQVEVLKEVGLIEQTITFNHAFGGDLEAVNVFSALLAAKHVCQADLAVILMGPGVVGTNTKWGTSALEQGIFLNAVDSLAGQPIGTLRVSFADPRNRHQGISHHCLTALQHVVKCKCHLALPFSLKTHPLISDQLSKLHQHQIHWVDTEPYISVLENSPFELRSMGRTVAEDPYFFQAAFAAGMLAGQLVPE